MFLGRKNLGPMEQAKLAIEEAGGDAQVVIADLRDPSEVRSLVDVAVERTGRLDIMVNNAGLEFRPRLLKAPQRTGEQCLKPTC